MGSLESLAFLVLALVAVGSAQAVVRVTNLVHAVLWLGVTLLATAALYASLGASFLAAVQVLVYVGGVVTLMIFGVMIARRHDGIVVPATSAHRVRGGLVAGTFFITLVVAIRATPGLDAPLADPAPSVSPAELAHVLVGEQLLAFEVLSVLLLGAMVGAIVIARRRDPTGEAEATRIATPSEGEVSP